MSWNPFKKKAAASEADLEQLPERPAAASAAEDGGDATDPLAQAPGLTERASLLREREGARLERVEIWSNGNCSDTFLRLSLEQRGSLSEALRTALLNLPESISGFRDLLVSPAALCAALEAPRGTLAQLAANPALAEGLRSADIVSLLEFCAELPGLLAAYELHLHELEPEDIGFVSASDSGALAWRFLGYDALSSGNGEAGAMPATLVLQAAITRLLDQLLDDAQSRGFAYALPAQRELRELLPVLGTDCGRIRAALASLRRSPALLGATDLGQRRKHNEDAYLLCSLEQQSMAGARFCLAAIADGMGGHASGEVASSLALDLLRLQLSQLLLMPRTKASAPPALGKQLEQVIPAISAVLLERASLDQAMGGMGTTLVGYCALEPQSTVNGEAAGGQARLFWVGDSRAYLLSSSGLRRLSSDHSHVQDLLSRGEIDEEEAFSHPQKNIITRCLGGGGGDSQPQHYAFSPAPGEILLLCSDGLSDALRDSEIWEVVQAVCSAHLTEEGNARSSRDAFLSALQHALIEAANNAGGPDNITVVLVAS